MSFPPGTEMFQFPGFASASYEFRYGYLLLGGLPHSDIHGSKPARGSPWLFAACHVLHRLLVPRHPPNALLSLEISIHHHKCSCNHLWLPTMHRNHVSSVRLASANQHSRRIMHNEADHNPDRAQGHKPALPHHGLPMADHLAHEAYGSSQTATPCRRF